MFLPFADVPLDQRLVDGLSKVATAIRAGDWERARAAELNPAQLSVLRLLRGRSAGLGVIEIASELGVSQPSASDTVTALTRKLLVTKIPSPNDRRSVRVVITKSGQTVVESTDETQSDAVRAVVALGAADKGQLLELLVKLIRELQEVDAIPIQRMCVSCRHFRPYLHVDAAQPHHCNFVDAAFGHQDIRIDCREHETADPAFRAATWKVFAKDHPNPPGK